LCLCGLRTLSRLLNLLRDITKCGTWNSCRIWKFTLTFWVGSSDFSNYLGTWKDTQWLLEKGSDRYRTFSARYYLKFTFLTTSQNRSKGTVSLFYLNGIGSDWSTIGIRFLPSDIHIRIVNGSSWCCYLGRFGIYLYLKVFWVGSPSIGIFSSYSEVIRSAKFERSQNKVSVKGISSHSCQRSPFSCALVCLQAIGLNDWPACFLDIVQLLPTNFNLISWSWGSSLRGR